MSNILDKNPELKKRNVKIYIDEINNSEIADSIVGKEKKFQRILFVMLSGLYSKELYKKEDENIVAMRFLGKENLRIYCKEYSNGGKKIILSIPHYKKNQRNKQKEKTLINKVKGYEYDFN